MASENLQPLVAAVAASAQAVKAAYLRAREIVGLADDAKTLDGNNGAAVRDLSGATFRTHIASRSNPHNVTAAQLNANTTSEMDDIIVALMPSGILPMSVMGIGALATRNFASISSGWQFQLAVSQCLMAGRRFTVPTKAFNLAEIIPVLAERQNRIFFLYLVLSEGSASYQFSASRLSESLSRMYIGKMQTTNTSINSVTVYPRQRLDLYSLSSAPAGMSIPSTSGSPTTLSGTLTAGWKT